MERILLPIIRFINLSLNKTPGYERKKRQRYSTYHHIILFALQLSGVVLFIVFTLLTPGHLPSERGGSITGKPETTFPSAEKRLRINPERDVG